MSLNLLSLPASHLCHQGLSWLTLHYCDIYYLSAVKYDPGTTDLIFIRVSIYPGPGKGVGCFLVIFQPIYFYQGHYLPCGPSPQY